MCGGASALALIEACALSALVKWSSQLNYLAGLSCSSIACITITLLAPYKHNDYYNREGVRGGRDMIKIEGRRGERCGKKISAIKQDWYTL